MKKYSDRFFDRRLSRDVSHRTSPSGSPSFTGKGGWVGSPCARFAYLAIVFGLGPLTSWTARAQEHSEAYPAYEEEGDSDFEGEKVSSFWDDDAKSDEPPEPLDEGGNDGKCDITPDDSVEEDKTNSTPRGPPGFAGKSGVTAQSLALPDGSGTMQGMGESFSPNLNTGSGTFSVPIAIPPGRRGMQPQIGLAYSTGAGNGPLGWGWSMGTPFISRQTDKGMPLYGPGDRFMYNGGQELVPIDMPDEEAWPNHVWDCDTDDVTYYRARVEGGFMRFFYNRTRDSWLVQDRQGNHFFYGESNGEKIIGPKGTYQWSLSRMADVRRATGNGGNDVHYVYLKDGRNLYVQDIYWNSYEHEYGELSKYQHNLHFEYEYRPDPSISFAAGFAIEQNLRLYRIEVASFHDAPGDVRIPTRAYFLTYEDETTSIHSRLLRIQVCGRDWAPGGFGTCMPPLDFTYSAIESVSSEGGGSGSFIEGFGYFNEMTRDFAVSPDVSAADANVEFMDINQDGLPDLLVTRPDFFGDQHAAIINDGLGGLSSEDAVPVENPAGWSLHLQNFNVSLLDIDGAGNTDLLHMPYGSEYSFYRLKKNRSTDRYYWESTDNIPVNRHIDFTADAQDIRLVDINNDHLIDVVRSTGGRMQHFLNLSAFPDHEGEFGRLDDSGRPVVGESIDTCLLYRGGIMQFHNGNLQFGDMNGDGVQDIVDLKSGSIGYWPGRGYGQWGDSDADCYAGEVVDNLDITMDNSPWFFNPEGEGISIADLNGDGLSDVLEIKFDAVAIWLNRGDNSFSDRHIIRNTPISNSGFLDQVRLADVNGSGTVDIVWTDAGGYKYLDLAGDYRLQDGNGGLPSGLLERVDNGLGATTYMEYASSVELMVDAQIAEDNNTGEAWKTVAPMPLTVIKKVTTTDNLHLIGGPEGVYTQEFVYRDPYYDGPEAEFKGFGYAEAWDREIDGNGDGQMDPELCSPESKMRGEAPLVGRNWFHRGVRPECMEAPKNPDWPSSWGPESPACSEKQHTDNPFLGLTGTSIKSDVYSPCDNKVVSASVAEIEVRRLYDSADPEDKRQVIAVIPDEGRLYKYELSEGASQGGGPTESYSTVRLTHTDYNPGTAAPDIGHQFDSVVASYDVAAPLGGFHRVVSNNKVDNHGYPTEAHYGGFHPYTNGYPYDKASCDGYSDYFVHQFDPMTWVHMQTESWSEGPGPKNGNNGDCTGSWMNSNVRMNWYKKSYTDWGELERSMITYLDVEPNGAGGYQLGSAPKEYCTYKDYNPYGQEHHSFSRCGGCGGQSSCLAESVNEYTYGEDAHYSAVIRQEKLRLHGPELEVRELTATAFWDVGFSQITKMISMAGVENAVEYDDLGRFSAAYGPNPETGMLCEETPTKTVSYHYDTAPMPYMETTINSQGILCGTQYADKYVRTAGFGSAESIYTYVDSMGRPFAVIKPGDKYLGSDAKYPWLINGYTELNKKGAGIRTCEGTPLGGPIHSDVQALFGLQPKDLNCGYQEFDAYGRPVRAYSPSSRVTGGYVRSEIKYGLDSVDSFDHLDLTDPCHIGTHSSQRVDGLDRMVHAVTRHRPSDENGENCEGEIVARTTSAEYELGALVTSEEENGVTISRRQLMDSLGRMRVNMGLNFGTWYYAYNDLGELVSTVSPTGNVTSVEYDGAGRLKRKYYGGALESEYFYDLYPGDARLGLDQVTGWEGYPSEWAKPLGRLVAVKEKTGVSVTAGNFGSRSESWRVLYPEDRIYHAETLTDHAGRLEYSVDADGDMTWVDYYPGPEGVAKGTWWSDYDPTTNSYVDHQIVKETKSNYLGQAELTEYADAAGTKVWSGYDPVTHQPMNTVVHQEHKDATLVAFGYAYDAVGKLEGVVDWRGRGISASAELTYEDPRVVHPSLHQGSPLGANYAAMPTSKGFKSDMPAPVAWNSNDLVSPDTGWPLGVTPSDARFEYDTLYQLIGEERTYINGLSGGSTGDDFPIRSDGTKGPSRVRALDWSFDQRGSMTRWEETGANAPDPDNLGRALGKTIVNGFQLNRQNGVPMDSLGSNNTMPAAGTYYIPDALYFASNIDPNSGLGEGRGTCVWVNYDVGGRMTSQHIRTGCNTCTFETKPWDTMVDWSANCPGAVEEGTHGTLDYKPAVDASYVHYDYYWDSAGRLGGAIRHVNGSPEISMSYIYDSGGGRVIREKSDVTGGNLTNIRQDIYLGGYERRQVSLIDTNTQNEASINEALADILSGVSDLSRYDFKEVDGTRLVKYRGVRAQWDYDDAAGAFKPPQLFLSFSNHLGSTSAVIDYADGALVEWKTHYAYGADESGWKNADEKYDNADEPYGFTGKEEDTAVGLHYFGARYYSSYIGRWLGPDPPVVHGGGFTNHFNYGGNSPYIYVDPDGRWIHIAIGAAVGAVAGFVGGLVSGKGIKGALIGAAIGAASGALIAATAGAAAGAMSTVAGISAASVTFTSAGMTGVGAGAALGGAVVGGMVGAGLSYAQARASGASKSQAGLSAAISFGASVVGAGVGAGVGAAASGLGPAAEKAISLGVGYVTAVGLAYAGAGANGSLNDENWDDILLNTSISFAISAAGNAIGSELQGIGVKGKGTEGGVIEYESTNSIEEIDLPAGPPGKKDPTAGDVGKESTRSMPTSSSRSTRTGVRLNLFKRNERLYDSAQKIEFWKDEFGVGGHGSPEGVQQSGARLLSPDSLADKITSHKDWNPKLKVRLISCDVGQGDYSQRLANAIATKTGQEITVIAPTAEPAVSTSGRIHMQIDERTGKTGIWLEFTGRPRR